VVFSLPGHGKVLSGFADRLGLDDNLLAKQ
jgi:hypothetical protein